MQRRVTRGWIPASPACTVKGRDSEVVAPGSVWRRTRLSASERTLLAEGTMRVKSGGGARTAFGGVRTAFGGVHTAGEPRETVEPFRRPGCQDSEFFSSPS